MPIRSSEINFFYKEIKEVLKKFKEWRKTDENTARQRLLEYINLCNIYLGNLIYMDVGCVKWYKDEEEEENKN